MGYSPAEEFQAYGDKITDLHIKDRLLGDGSVQLGTGNADFPTIFELLSKYNYQGLIILQAFRDDEGIEIFKEQLNWFLKKANA
jgi:sugar phosphate isomerase/epimerase